MIQFLFETDDCDTKRDALTKHNSEEQSNGLEIKGIQTDKQHSFFRTLKVLGTTKKKIEKSIIPTISHQIRFISLPSV